MKKFDFLQKSIIGDEEGERLPSFRKEQYLYLLRDHYVLIFASSWLLALFTLPALAYQVYMSYQLSLLTSVGNADLLSWCLVAYGGMIPLCMLASLGFCGDFAMVIELIKGKSASLSVFFKGIKDNWLTSLFLGLVVGVSLFLSVFSYLAYSSGVSDFFFRSLLSGLSLLIGLVVVSFSFYALGVKLRYLNGFWRFLKTSSTLFFKRLLPAVLCLLPILLCFVLPAFLAGAWQVAAYLIAIILLLPLFTLGYEEYQSFALDNDVNKALFPDHFRQGLDQHQIKE